MALNHILLTLTFLAPSALGVDWKGNNWAMKCDFNNNDLDSVRCTGQECSRKCFNNPECTHYVWTNYQGGTCWMKKNPVSKSNAFDSTDNNMVCGVVDRSINWQSGNWATKCDIPGNDIYSVRQPYTSAGCGGSCASESRCTHFTWSMYNGGTCWLKGDTVSKADATSTSDASMVCGLVERNGDQSETLSNVLATRHAAFESGACELPFGSYLVTFPDALGNIDSLQSLKYSPAMCGQVLTIDCGNGALDIIVTNANLGGGLDLYASTWDRATGNKPPGETMCSVKLSTRSILNGNPSCYYAPGSEKNNNFFKLLGIFNTNGRMVVGAMLAGVSGSFNGLQPYFSFSGGPFASNAQVQFKFSDGTSFITSLQSCNAENGKQMWS